jgi:hypothetical protein
MSTLSQFFGKGNITGSRHVIVQSTQNVLIPSNVKYVAYAVMGAGSSGSSFPPLSPSVGSIGGPGGGFSYREGAVSCASNFNACVIIGGVGCHCTRTVSSITGLCSPTSGVTAICASSGYTCVCIVPPPGINFSLNFAGIGYLGNINSNGGCAQINCATPNSRFGNGHGGAGGLYGPGGNGGVSLGPSLGQGNNGGGGFGSGGGGGGSQGFTGPPGSGTDAGTSAQGAGGGNPGYCAFSSSAGIGGVGLAGGPGTPGYIIQYAACGYSQGKTYFAAAGGGGNRCFSGGAGGGGGACNGDGGFGAGGSGPLGGSPFGGGGGTMDVAGKSIAMIEWWE